MEVKFFTSSYKLISNGKLKLAHRFNYTFALSNLSGDVVLDVGSGARKYFAKLVERTGRKYYHCDLAAINKIRPHPTLGVYRRNYFVADGRHLPAEACADTITALWWIHHYKPLENCIKIIEHLRSRCRRLVFTVDYNIPNISKPQYLPPSPLKKEKPRSRGFSSDELSQLGVKNIPDAKDLIVYGGPKIALVGFVMDGYLTEDKLQSVEEILDMLVGRNFI